MSATNIPRWQALPVLSGHTVRRLIDAPDGPIELSLDLGRTTTQLEISDAALVLPDGVRIPVADNGRPITCILRTNHGPITAK